MDNNEEYRLGKLRELQLEELKLIKLFTDICNREHLTYFLVCGSMLGAVRHHGFIPWDDDSDLAMPRADYEKFIKIAPRYLPSENIALKTFRCTPDHPEYFTKLTSMEMQVKVTGRVSEWTDNAWIDIFPLDGMPGPGLAQCVQKVRLLLLRRLYALSIFEKGIPIHKKGRAWYDQLVVNLCLHLHINRLFSQQKIGDQLDKALKKYPYESSPNLVNMMCAYKFREMFPKEVFGEGAFYEFEGMRLRGPKDYDTYLKQLYGDYMTPPPESQRNWHGTEFFENEAEKVDWKTQ